MKKTEGIEQKIITELVKNKVVPANFLAEKLQISEKTVRQYIYRLNDYLNHFECEIISKIGSGYQLEISNENKFSQIYKNGKLLYTSFMNPEDRVNYIIAYLLIQSKNMDIMEFCELLNISESTLLSDIRNVKMKMDEADIKLINKRNSGSKIQGDEFKIRVCMSNYLSLYLNLRNDDLGNILENRQLIAELILNAFLQHNVTMPEISVDNLINHICISIFRIKNNNKIKISLKDHEDIRNQNIITLKIVEEICCKIERFFNITFSKFEIDYIVIYMLGQRLNKAFDMENRNIVISNNTLETVNETLEFIYKTLNIDFINHFSLITDLSIHMISLEIRLNYNMKITNPLTYEIKKNFSLGYTIALQAGIFLENKFRKKINEDEIAYIALIFELSMRKNSKSYSLKLKNIVIVCATGKASAEILAYEFRKLFGEHLNQIEICNLLELKNFDFSNIDFVFTTTPININLSVPIFETNFFLNNDDIKELQKRFEINALSSVRQYYSAELFFLEQYFNSKEEVLNYMCKKIEKVRNVPLNFLESVLKREELGPTDFGEIVALPHPLDNNTEVTFASACVLKKPVFWGNKNISIVLLISISENHNENLDEFYQITSEFLLNNTKAKKLLKLPTFDNLVNLLAEK